MKKTWLFVVGAILLSILVSASAPLNLNAATDQPPWLPNEYADLCGNGSEVDDYGFNYSLQQYHWTVDGERYLESDTIDELDKLFDQLVADQVVETMILFKPVDEVGNRVNCAVHFLRYMQLGQPSGERKDNGFVFLVVVEEQDIDVHYGVGLGLPALTAHNLTDLNRLGEDTYADTGSMDKAVLTMAYAYANYAREQYPAITSQSGPVQSDSYGSTTDGNSTDSIPMQIAGFSGANLACLCCISMIVLVMFIMILSRFGRRRRYFPPVIRRGPTIWRPTSGRSGGFGGSGGFRPPRMRGGGGSGRSHRGN
ncbi:MAG: hypothetical protein JEZ00_22090 [Anaerolineaceae bacterium]|nr:hypothetical protein [Anaerolineaceae bacterium]